MVDQTPKGVAMSAALNGTGRPRQTGQPRRARQRRLGSLVCRRCLVKGMTTQPVAPAVDEKMPNWLNSVEPIVKYATPLRKSGREKSQTCLGNSINTVYEIDQRTNFHNSVVEIRQRILRQEQAKFEKQKLLALAASKKGAK